MLPTLRYLRLLVLAKLGVNPYGINPHVKLVPGVKSYWRLQETMQREVVR